MSSVIRLRTDKRFMHVIFIGGISFFWERTSIFFFGNACDIELLGLSQRTVWKLCNVIRDVEVRSHITVK